MPLRSGATWLWAMPLVTACAGQQIAELEQEHTDLRAEYDDLEQNVVALRSEMVALGLINEQQATAKAAKAPKSGRAPRGRLPETRLKDTLGVTAERTGEPTELPPLPEAERQDNPCGWKFFMRELQPLSDFPLNRDGLGKSSPLQLLENGTALKPHANPEDFADACTGSVRHAGFVFLFSPSGEADSPLEQTYTLALDPRFPMPRGDDDRPMYWVYPGTTATFTIDGAWDDQWGVGKLELGGRVIDLTTDGAQVTAPGIQETLSTGGDFIVTKELGPTDGAFTIEVSSPANGPYVLLNQIQIGNPDNALVISSDAQWAADKP